MWKPPPTKPASHLFIRGLASSPPRLVLDPKGALAAISRDTPRAAEGMPIINPFSLIDRTEGRAKKS
jgi:hypothetical protein